MTYFLLTVIFLSKDTYTVPPQNVLGSTTGLWRLYITACRQNNWKCRGTTPDGLSNAVHAGHFPQVFNKLRFGRYPQRINFHHTPLRLQDREQFFSFYENLPMRKRFGGKRVAPFYPPKGDDAIDSFENLFDDNGMIMLTLPHDDEDRLLNRLLNDIVYYKAAKNEVLRGRERNLRDRMMKNILRSKDEFNSDDIAQKRNILRSKSNLDLENAEAVTPRLVYDFNEIVG